MEKCRLCLKDSRRLKNIFDYKENQSYAEMIKSIANVKIHKDDGITDQICISCQLKTVDSYNFKLQVERSQEVLLQNDHIKRVNFRDINDIKNLIDITEQDNKQFIPSHIRDLVEIPIEEPIVYNNVSIKKVHTDDKPLTVIDFLKSFRDEEDDSYDDNFDCELQVDYDPDFKNDPDFKVIQQPRKKRYKTKAKEVVLRKPLKPIFLADYAVKPHVYKKKKTDIQTKKKLKKEHICPYCGKLTQSIKSHLMVHEEFKPFQCERCPRVFASKYHLKAHLKVCNVPKTVKCEQCVAAFANETALKSHMLVHTKEKKYICDFCNKAFKRKSHLKRHADYHIDKVVKPWKCKQCNEILSSKHSLVNHYRVHTRERPYKCEMCSQPYSYKPDFNRHCLKKHGVCFTQRSVYVLNEEVLQQERILMRDLMLRLNGVLKDDKPINPFEGPHAALAFERMVNAIKSGKIVVDLQL